MESMTGYSFIESRTKQFSFSVEVKSLNTRYLEVYVNMPKNIRFLENDFNSFMKEKITRGKTELNIEIYDWIEARSVEINKEVLKKYYEVISSAEKDFDGKSFSLDSLLTLDGVLSRGRTQISDASINEIEKTVKKAIDDMLKMRKKEGKSVEKDVLSSVKSITASVAKIKKMSKNAAKENFEKLKERLNKIIESSIDESRLYTELAILSDKLDVNEELSRLDDHIKKFKSTAKESGQIGKRLDFIAQEMFREINTIASKSNSSQISQEAVLVKNYIDKIREQSRNII